MFSQLLEGFKCGPVFKNVWESSIAKNYRPVSLLSVVSKIFEKLVNNRIVDHPKYVTFFLICSMILGLLDQLQIFWQLHLIELLGLLTGLGLLELWHLIYPRLLTGFGMLVFFTNLSFMEFQVRYLALFLLFSVVDSFEWFWMGSLYKNIQLILEFLKPPFLILHFSYFASMTYLTMLSVILLSMLTILLSILSVIRHLICGNNFNWLLNLNLIYKTLSTGTGNGLFISMLKKLTLFRLTGLITLVLFMWKWMVLFLRKNRLLLSSSKSDCGSYIISIAKTVSKKIGSLIHSTKFFSLEFTLHLFLLQGYIQYSFRTDMELTKKL